MRVAIYARYSHKEQNPLSVRDQVDCCVDFAARQSGWTVVQTFADAAQTGRDDLTRDSWQKLQRAAQAGEFDVVLAYDVSRLSRRTSVLTRFEEDMSFRGVEVFTTKTGRLTPIMITALGIAAQVQAESAGEDTRRGQAARWRDGKWTGRAPYGYRVVPAPDGQGKTLEIVEDEAAVVVRIHELFAAGSAPEAISDALNREGVPGPGGRVWANTTIRGQRKRATGILRNPAYRGSATFNRCRFAKHPRTDKRAAKPHDPSTWQRTHVPAWQIVPEELAARVDARFEAIRRRMADGRANGDNPLNGAHRPKYLLSGRLKCGACGGAYTIRDRHNYRCGRHKKSGASVCAQTAKVNRRDAEARVMHALSSALLSPTYVDAFRAELARSLDDGRNAPADARAKLERELAEREAKIARLLDQLEEGVAVDRLRARLTEHEARLAELRAELAAPVEVDVDAFLRDALDDVAVVYRRQIAALVNEVERGDAAPEVFELVRGLVDEVVVHPAGNTATELVVRGDLAGILRLCAQEDAAPEGRRSSFGDLVQLSVVAGVGFEPTTFRL
ncbi:MAG: recombinase family protein [Alphaproteobacteria bacterium]